MHPGFGCEIAKRILADDVERDGLDAGLLTFLIVEHRCLEAILLGPSQIHAHQHLGPILGLSAAGTRMNIDNGIQAVVFTGQQHFRLDAIDKTLGLRQLRRQVVDHGFTFAGQVNQSLRIVHLTGYLAIELEAFFEAGALLIDFAGAFLVGPEVGFGNQLLQFVKLALFGAAVKETSGRPRCES